MRPRGTWEAWAQWILTLLALAIVSCSLAVVFTYWWSGS